jgi:drug/metabolite transporter (DMT)-like permease
VERAPLSIAIPLVSSWSVIATLFAGVVLHEQPSQTQLAGGALVIAGVLLVSIASGRAAATPGVSARRAVLAGLGSAVGFGVMVPAMNAGVAPRLGAFAATALIYGLGVALGLPIALALRLPLRPPPRRVWPLLLVTGAFETLGFVAVTAAHRFAPNAVVTPVSSLASALTVLYAWVALRERPHPLAGAGALLASLGIVVLAR